VNISIFGVGYVGSVTAGCLSRDGHTVAAMDVDAVKLEALSAGRAPVVEPGLDPILETAVRSGQLSVVRTAADALAGSEVSMVCVGTPGYPNGALDTTYITRVAEEIGEALRRKNDFHSVVVRSTVLPGTTDEIIIPLLERASGKRAGQNFGVAYYPEFLREGSAIHDYDHPGAIIFGKHDDVSLQRLLELHPHPPVEPRVMAIRAAEAAKYASNAWHATKISFANELGLICRAFGIDSHDVMESLCADTRLNISPAYLSPGFAFGGSCLPKDLRALRYRARAADVDTPLLDAVLEANANQVSRAYELVENCGARRVGMIGLSFKPETDDLRYSPLVDLAERLIGRGFQLKIYDPIIRLSRLKGANREHIRRRLPHIADLLLEKINELIEHSEVIVLGNRQVAKGIMPSLVASDKQIIDLVRVEREMRSADKYQGLCW
jgi:GDP-mannose 6-dehydrogenase